MSHHSTRIVSWAAIALAISACVSETSTPTSPPTSLSEDERTNAGVPNATLAYCQRSGGTVVPGADASGGPSCQFVDGTSCDAAAFFRGTCGASNSYCTKHGGTLAPVEKDMGTWTALYGECSFNGVLCPDYVFAETKTCKPW